MRTLISYGLSIIVNIIRMRRTFGENANLLRVVHHCKHYQNEDDIR